MISLTFCVSNRILAGISILAHELLIRPQFNSYIKKINYVLQIYFYFILRVGILENKFGFRAQKFPN